MLKDIKNVNWIKHVPKRGKNLRCLPEEICVAYRQNKHGRIDIAFIIGRKCAATAGLQCGTMVSLCSAEDNPRLWKLSKTTGTSRGYKIHRTSSDGTLQAKLVWTQHKPAESEFMSHPLTIHKLTKSEIIIEDIKKAS